MKKKVTDLTLEEKIGQLIVFGFHEDYFGDNVERLIRDYKLGNILLFTRNITSPEKLFTLNKKTQQNMLKHLGIPAYITVDQEGGMVTRLYDGGTVFPGAMTLSATNDPNNAYLSGLYMADELDALGVNVNFAPVLDVNNNPLNPVIGVRSFGDTAERVSLYANEFIRGMQTKVIATAKHFPGHGDTNVDSHLALPNVDFDMERLEEVELAPFKSAINDDIKAIMSAHIVYKHLTNGFPATLSKEALTDLLRDDLKFEGLIFTDGMEMKAILNKYGAVEAAVPAILAGANLLLYCHYEDQQMEVVKVIKDAVLDGTLPIEIIDERVERILKYKEDLNLDILNNEFKDIKARVGNDKHMNFAQGAVNDALTLVKGEVYKEKAKTLFIGQLPKATSGADATDGKNSTIAKLEKELPNFEYILTSLNPDEKEINDLKKLASKYKQVILTTYNSNVYLQQVELVKEINSLDLELHVISLRNPYDHYLVPEIKNYVCLYEYTNNSINTLKDYLLGKIKPKGVLPLNV